MTSSPMFAAAPVCLRSSLFVACALGCAAAPGFAQMAPKLEPVAASQEFPNLALELSLYKYENGKVYGRKTSGQPNAGKLLGKGAARDTDTTQAESLRIGEAVVACVYASRAGTLTIWSQLGAAPPIKVYPNKYTPSAAGAGRIGSDEEVCVGQAQDFRLRVAGKAGEIDKVYAHWAPDMSAQLAESDFPAIGRAARASKATATYASSTVQFRIAN